MSHYIYGHNKINTTASNYKCKPLSQLSHAKPAVVLAVAVEENSTWHKYFRLSGFPRSLSPFPVFVSIWSGTLCPATLPLCHRIALPQGLVINQTDYTIIITFWVWLEPSWLKCGCGSCLAASASAWNPAWLLCKLKRVGFATSFVRNNCQCVQCIMSAKGIGSDWLGLYWMGMDLPRLKRIPGHS